MTPSAWRVAGPLAVCVAFVPLLAACDSGRPTPMQHGEPVSTPAPASTPATTALPDALVDDSVLTELEATLDDIDRILAEVDAELSTD